MDVFDLVAKLTLDSSDYDTKLTGAEKSANSFGSRISGAVSSFAGNFASNVVTKGIDVVTQGAEKAVDAMVGITEKSLDAYSAYEQLSGGVETLFGESYDTVMANADNAFATAGMSANAYMETVTSFSASLLQGLGGNTELAAEIADRAIIDMSDNANKMGTDISSIQTAYAGFAKQNYTLLDNLKLGYGGTKEEMSRLIAEASTMTDAMDVLGVSVDAESMSFDNIINAISVVQTNLGIAGTTSKEASTTIEGSANSMKAAWENLVTGFGNDNADMGALIADFVDTLLVNAQNVVPRIVEIIKGFTENLPEILTSVTETFSEWLNADTLTELMSGLTESAEPIIDAVSKLMEVFVDALEVYLPVNAEMGVKLLTNLIEGLLLHTDELAVTAVRLITAIVEGFVKALPTIAQYAPELIATLTVSLIEAIPALMECADVIINAFGDSIKTIWQELKDKGYWLDMIKGFVEVFTGYDWDALGENIIDGLKNGLTGHVKKVYDTVYDIALNTIKTFKDVLGIASPSKKFKYYGEMIVEGLTDSLDAGQRDVVKASDNLAESLSGTFERMSIEGPIRTLSGVISPEQVTDNNNVVNASGNSAIISLLTEQNMILVKILEKDYGRTGEELFATVRRAAQNYELETGNYAFG